MLEAINKYFNIKYKIPSKKINHFRGLFFLTAKEDPFILVMV